MFKKPGKKFFRKKQSGDSDDEAEKSAKNSPRESEETSVDVTVLPATTITPTAVPVALGKSNDVPTVSAPGAAANTSSAPSKLSFEDGEDDSEEFRVKKSNRSRKIAKKLKEEWKEDQGRPKTTSAENAAASLNKMNLTGTAAQKSAEKDDSSDIEILYGDDYEVEDSSEYRRPTAPPTGRGGIPDSKLIADAKKRREEARKAEDDFIPLDDTERFAAGKSRLVREDENDNSDEDEELVMSSNGGQFLGSKDVAALNRRRNREFFELDEMIGQNQNDSDEEIQRWEEAQIRKGVTLPQIQAHSEEMNRPPADQQYYYGPNGYTAVDSDLSYSHDARTPPTISTVEDIRKKIRNRMEQAKEQQRRHNNELDKVTSDLTDCNNAIRSLNLELTTASAEYKFYQEMRGFVLDLVDCYNDKLPQIITVEDQTLAIWKRGCKAASDLRQQYIKDRCEEIHSKHSIELVPNLAQIAERRSRLADYLERRKALASSVGMSIESFDMDDYEPTGTPQTLESVANAAAVFDDTVSDFKSLPSILKRFVQWRTDCSHSYSDAWIALCIPKLVAPLIRFKLLGWNPIKPGGLALLEMPWFRDILTHLFVASSSGTVTADDPDIRVLPMLVEDVIFTRLSALLDTWDPMSQVQSARLVALLRELFARFPTIAMTRKPVQDFFRALVQRLIQTIEDEIYLPVYSQRILETDKEAVAFVSDQFRAAFKLFCNILLFHGILSNAALVELSLERLLNRYLLLPLRTSHDRKESVARCVAIAARIPEDRLCTGPSPPTVPKHLEMFCHVTTNLGKQNPSREEVADLSKILQRLKDFKGAEVLEKQLLSDR
ncbi:PAX3- and PAX7-binding protein 1 [Hypsibius exemplaris]|uniref:PAX3- and PAX7-binding protein 1 n=1 Tax=Hypsibius exemplaris TaxID=2072580 RepID=A0A1W0WLF7_HYPEX|nr:PAX3- and PAX7-binding protein 1 [Hypsibius exemplaris]